MSLVHFHYSPASTNFTLLSLLTTHTEATTKPSLTEIVPCGFKFFLLRTDCYCDNELSNFIGDEYSLIFFSYLKAKESGESLCFQQPFPSLETFHLIASKVDTWGFRFWLTVLYFRYQHLPQALLKLVCLLQVF